MTSGSCTRRTESGAKAEELFRGAIDARPDSAEAHYSLGLVCAQQTQYEQAEKLFLTAIQLRSGYPEALSDLAGVYLETRRARQALPLLERARKGNPQLAQVYLNEARAHLAVGDKPSAILSLRALLKIQPENRAAADALRRLDP